MHSVTSLVFDVNADSSDLVIAGLVELDLLLMSFPMSNSNGFIYFVEEKSCSVRWMVLNDSFNMGVKQIAFDPNNRNFIFGVTTTIAFPILFYIDNTFPESVDSIKIFSTDNFLSPIMLPHIIEMQMMDSVGRLSWL